MRYGRASGSARRGMYVTGYLRSIPWFRRRDRWFAAERQLRGEVRCVICLKTGAPGVFELHHLDYTRVIRDEAQGWIAGEAHEDLVAAHPRCHEWIHEILDRDAAAGAAADRRSANLRVIARLRAKFADQIRHLEEQS